MSKDPKEVLRFNQLVCDLADDMEKMICERIKDIDPSQRWLITGRAINRLFQIHYRVGLVFAEDQLKKEETISK